MDHLKWFFGIFILLGIIWYAGGGAQVAQRPFVEEPDSFGAVTQYGDGQRQSVNFVRSQQEARRQQQRSPNQELVATEEESVFSIFRGSVFFNGAHTGRETDPSHEYVTITASHNNLQPINITNWKLRSAITGNESRLGEGVSLFYAGRVNSSESIFLHPGDQAIITSGRSPLGVSFRINECSGYLEQFQDFSPHLWLSCPRAADEPYPTGINGVEDACIDFLETIPSCRINTKTIPPLLSSTCHNFIATDITYNGCVDNHRSDGDFFKNEWRVFMKRSTDYWKAKRETILLLDENDKIVDSLSY